MQCQMACEHQKYESTAGLARVVCNFQSKSILLRKIIHPESKEPLQEIYSMTCNMGYHVGSPRFGQMHPCNGDVESKEVSSSGSQTFEL